MQTPTSPFHFLSNPPALEMSTAPWDMGLAKSSPNLGEREKGLNASASRTEVISYHSVAPWILLAAVLLVTAWWLCQPRSVTTPSNPAVFSAARLHGLSTTRALRAALHEEQESRGFEPAQRHPITNDWEPRLRQLESRINQLALSCQAKSSNTS